MVWIGDSDFVAGDSGIRHGVEDRAREAGALADGDEYRAYYGGGAQVANGDIPGQYDSAKAADPDIAVVVMDGGGNDIGAGHPECLTSPPPGNAACVTVWDGILAALDTLWDEMEADGVSAIVFMGYPHLGIAGGNENVDYSTPRIQPACEGRTAPACVFVDPRTAFEGQSYLEPDGIHPNAAGQDVLAGLLWDAMDANGIAQ